MLYIRYIILPSPSSDEADPVTPQGHDVLKPCEPAAEPESLESPGLTR